MTTRVGMSLEEFIPLLKEALREGGLKEVERRFKVSQRTAYRFLRALGIKRLSAWRFPNGEIVIEEGGGRDEDSGREPKKAAMDKPL